MQLQDPPPAKVSSTTKKQSLLFHSCVAVVIISFVVNLLWFISYRQNNDTIADIRQAVANYNTQQEQAIAYPYLDTLHTLYLIKQETERNYLLSFANLLLPNERTAKHLVNTAYYQLLQTEFLPDLQMLLSIEMQSSTLENPSDLYSALKVYLMLSNKLPRNSHYISQWFYYYWQRTLANDPVKQRQLNKLLADSLQQKDWSFTANPALIQQARSILHQMPSAQLSLAILEDQNSHLPALPLFDANTGQLFNSTFSIPAIYTVASLNDVYYQRIPQACQELTHDSAVLGVNPMPVSNYGFNILINETRTAYLQRYAQTWQQALTNLSIAQPKNLSQNLQLIDAISDFNSPILHLYSLVLTNTAPNPNIPQFDALISKNFGQINGLLSQLTSQAWQNTWRKLDQYLSNAVNDEKLFDLVAKRMNNTAYDDALSQLFQKAQNYPEPLKTLSLQIAGNTWHLLLLQSQSYINQVWANTVLPEYAATLNQRYPLSSKGQQEISLPDFIQFFAPGGTLDGFVTTYLKPFIDDSKQYWAWKTLDGQHMAIPTTTLDTFIRAALVQQAYFPEHGNKPKIEFELIPLKIPAEIRHLELNFAKQTLKYDAHKKNSAKFIWPAAATTDKLTIELIDKHQKNATFTAQGPWAWLHLFDQSQIKTTDNPKELEIFLELGGYTINYRLKAASVINPFMPGLLENLQLPQQL